MIILKATLRKRFSRCRFLIVVGLIMVVADCRGAQSWPSLPGPSGCIEGREQPVYPQPSAQIQRPDCEAARGEEVPAAQAQVQPAEIG
jgi:hypothetical protein